MAEPCTFAAKTGFKRGISRVGFTPVWLVDEAGNLLHTEPVCTVATEWFDWFLHWLEAQECPVRLPNV